MSSAPQPSGRYVLSFTTGALLVQESSVVCPLYLKTRDWSLVREQLRSQNMLQTRTVASGTRLSREVVQRLAVLTDLEMEFLCNAGPGERAYMMWLAACRRYTFIGEFAEEVVREKFLLLAPGLRYEDFDSFVRLKSVWHPELETIKPTTMRKLRATLFQMLTEAGLLMDGEIVTAVLSESMREILNMRIPSDTRYFPVYQGNEVPL